MRKSNIKQLIAILILIIMLGTLLVLAINNNPNLIDRSIVVGTPQILFVLLSSFIIMFALFLLVMYLNKQRRYFNRRVKLVTEPSTENLPAEPIEVIIQEKEPDVETNEALKRFFMLSQIDQDSNTQNQLPFNNEITLKELCEEFRHFSASQLGLYYDISDIRRFIGGLAVSHIMILQGMSGTGKTSLAYAFGEYLKNSTVVVPIQPMWKERTDLIGYYNEFTKKFNETTLLQKAI